MTVSDPATSTPRQLIVCCDGTNNTLTGREHDTNVLRLTDLLDPEQANQRLYYDPGVGSPDQMPSTGPLDWFDRKWERVQGLASGKGIYENVSMAYQFLIEHYRPGDQVFLFGFSRGAFTARCVAGMVNLFGLIRPDSVALIPTLIHVYFSDRSNAGSLRKDKCSRAMVAQQIQEKFTDACGREATLHFLGVWDTVASVGLPILLATKITSDGLTQHKRTMHLRHALALDEHRASFQPRLFWENDYDLPEQGRSLRQCWFRGVHADVGGGYVRDEAQLSDQAFDWMIEEAKELGLRVVNMHIPSVRTQEKQKRQVTPTADPQRMAVVHDQCFASPYWGIAGLVARDFILPQEANRTLTPMSAKAAATGQAVVSVWTKGLPWKRMLLVLVLMALCGVLAGFWGWQTMHGDIDWRNATLGQAWQGAAAFDTWQRAWALASAGDMLAPRLPDGFVAAHAVKAIAVDFVLIALYGWVLGLLASWAFAHLAGLRQAGQAVPAVLWLGWAPCVAFFADLLENLATLLVIWTAPGGMLLLPWLFAVVMALANLAKWMGLAGSALLVGFAMFSRARLAIP